MPSGNRVEKLEQQVQELEATVEGLTEELVEANERIRQLEGALSGDTDGADAEPADTGGDELLVGGEGEPEPTTDDAADGLEKQFDVDGGADPQEVEAAASEVVPADDERTADTSKGDEDDAGDEGESDDIIVA